MFSLNFRKPLLPCSFLTAGIVSETETFFKKCMLHYLAMLFLKGICHSAPYVGEQSLQFKQFIEVFI